MGLPFPKGCKMPVSAVDICNIALIKLDNAARIESMDEDYRPARLCNQFYIPVRDALLREHPWNFAQKRIALAKLAEVPAFGFTSKFTIPTDCLHVRQIYPDQEFVIESGELLTNADTANIIYTRRVENEAEFDACFVTSFAARLACEIAQPLTGSVEKVQAMNTLFLNELQKARLADSAEGKEDPTTSEPWLEARGISADSETPLARR